MITKEMPLPGDGAHIEADQHDALGSEQDREIDRLETGIRAVVNAGRIEGEAITVAALDQLQPIFPSVPSQKFLATFSSM